MAENKSNKNKNQNNPFDRFNSGKKNDGKGPKFNAYWIYGIIAIIFIIVNFYFSNSHGPVKTDWNHVKSTMLANQDVKKVVLITNTDPKKVYVYLKKESYEKYKSEFDGTFSQPSETGPQFKFSIGSVETFEKQFSEAQENLASKAIID
jgi:AFG3 family protein